MIIIPKHLELCRNIVKIYQQAVNNKNAIVHFAENNLTDLFNFKAKMTDQTGNDGEKNIEIMVPLEYLSNFWRILEI